MDVVNTQLEGVAYLVLSVLLLKNLALGDSLLYPGFSLETPDGYLNGASSMVSAGCA